MPATKKKALPPILTGGCAGTRHDLCLGAVRTPSGVHLCRCDCHAGQKPACTHCRSIEDVDEADRSCNNKEACQDTQRQRTLRSTTWQMIQECKTQPKGAAMPKKEPTPRTKKAGVCQWCGGITKGGIFHPGHDAKLKSELLKLAAERAGRTSVEACAELIARSWPTGLIEDDPTYAEAAALVEQQGADPVIASSTATRQQRQLSAVDA